MHFHTLTLTTAIIIILATLTPLATAHGGRPVDSRTPSCGAPFCARRVLAEKYKDKNKELVEIMVVREEVVQVGTKGEGEGGKGSSE